MFEQLTNFFPQYQIKRSNAVSDEESMSLEQTTIARHFFTFKELKKTWDVPVSFFSSEEVAKLLELYHGCLELEKQEWNVTLSNKNVHNSGKGILAFSDALLKAGKALMSLQRYKGLGEMNPDQLWDTTMDPSVRTLIKVSVENAMEADMVFDMLMGDEVEPRRNYIVDNAQFVKNLDI